jgi:chromosome segregation ATPase
LWREGERLKLEAARNALDSERVVFAQEREAFAQEKGRYESEREQLLQQIEELQLREQQYQNRIRDLEERVGKSSSGQKKRNQPIHLKDDNVRVITIDQEDLIRTDPEEYKVPSKDDASMVSFGLRIRP